MAQQSTQNKINSLFLKISRPSGIKMTIFALKFTKDTIRELENALRRHFLQYDIGKNGVLSFS